MSKTLDIGVTRRQFLKWSTATVTAAVGFPFGGCSLSAIKPHPIKGHKIQPPENGCFYGIGGPDWINVEMYERWLGKRPAIANTQFWIHTWKWHPYYHKHHKKYFETGVIPVLQVGVSLLSKVVKGVHDDEFKRLAEAMYKLGNQYGGFFFSPMWEMNLDRRVWGWSGRPNGFKDAWRHIWHIFEDQGTNQYATWTPSYHVDGSHLSGYWPGNEYVDWIGFSAYNRRAQSHIFGYRNLDTMIGPAYRHFARRRKPYMLQEMGTTIYWRQTQWLRKAYAAIKERPNIKAALYWDFLTALLGDDHTLSQEGEKTLREIVKDPYFIGATDKSL